MKRTTIVLLLLIAATSVAAETVDIVVTRSTRSGDGVPGVLFVNGEPWGTTLENASYLIPAGTYRGHLRYVSQKNFVQGPKGEIGRKGDFLIEVAGVSERTDILLHGGNAPGHSTGCILLGAIPKKDGKPTVPDDHPLRRLRLLFYGTDEPVASPNKSIRITLEDP